MSQRFERQLFLIGDSGQRVLSESCVAVIGCGGLGSIVITDLASAGVGHLILVDGDTVSESNMNRQFIHAGRMGSSKAESAAEWVSKLYPDCKVDIFSKYLGLDDSELISDADVVVDCLDSSEDRVMLGHMCIKEGKVLVHAAVDAYHGQVAVIRPEDVLRMDHIYPRPSKGGVHHAISTAVTFIGSLEANEVINVLIGSEHGLRDEILSVDLNDYSMSRYRIGSS
ncbi:MAG: HesA/MoeB/ThiF family protein [Candidatus Methanomethylophilaceae archaeon]|nr:HesA/MoeB/ThiF family protein [Candidatus Methanomethylophilaceae archaeon]